MIFFILELFEIIVILFLLILATASLYSFIFFLLVCTAKKVRPKLKVSIFDILLNTLNKG